MNELPHIRAELAREHQDGTPGIGEPREWASMVGGPRCGEAFEVPAGSQRFRSGKAGDKRVHLYLRSDRTSNVGGRACVVFTHSEVWS